MLTSTSGERHQICPGGKPVGSTIPDIEVIAGMATLVGEQPEAFRNRWEEK